MIDPRRMTELRGVIDATITSAPCDWCGAPGTRKQFIRENNGSRQLEGEELTRVVTRFYRCLRCKGAVHLKAEIPETELRAA